jgi:hypothetical protein
VDGELTEVPNVGHTKKGDWRIFLGGADCDGANHFPIRQGQETLPGGKSFGAVSANLLHGDFNGIDRALPRWQGKSIFP